MFPIAKQRVLRPTSCASNDSLVPRAVIADWTFNAELASVAVEDDQDKGATRQSSISPRNRRQRAKGLAFYGSCAVVEQSSQPDI
jgi:hypothetical protein